MRLHENAVYLKFTTYSDLLDGGGHEELIERLEAVTRAQFTTFRDLGGPRMPSVSLIERRHALLGAHVGAGFHQTARFRLESDRPMLRSLELTAGLHPYSGVYAVNIDARFDAEWAERNAQELVDLATWCIARFDPLTLQVHDVDDDAMQNIDSARLLELGYGVTGPTDLASRPGREAIRGQFRFVMAWLSYFGPDALDLLGRPSFAGLGIETQAIGRGRLVRLSASAADAGAPQFRARQAALRATLGVDALISRDRHSHSYWKTKP